jgi:hypothetical protein
VKRRAASEKFRDLKTRDVQFREQFDHRRKCRYLADASTPKQDARAGGKHLEQRRDRSDMEETI